MAAPAPAPGALEVTMQQEVIDTGDQERIARDRLRAAVLAAQGVQDDPIALRRAIGLVKRLETEHLQAQHRSEAAMKAWRSHDAIGRGVAAVDTRGQQVRGQLGDMESLVYDVIVRLDSLEARVSALEGA